jgi:hypothetical protein
MKKALFIMVMSLGCQKHDDSGPITSESATPAASATLSATPLATIEPSATASAAPIARDGGDVAQVQRQLALSKEAEAMQLQMLKAFGSAAPAQGVLDRGDLPPVELSKVVSQMHDAGSVEFGSGRVLQKGGPGGPGAGGLSGIGARDH